MAARLTLLAAFCLALVLPREAMPCCKGGTCCPSTTLTRAVHACCGGDQADEQPPAQAPPVHSDRDSSPLGGLGCGSPCCTKAPAPARDPLALLLDDSGLIPSLPVPAPPAQPDAGAIFHPPRF